MHRRFLLAALLPMAMGKPAWARTPPTEQEPQALPQYSVSTEQLQLALAQRFPIHHPMPGLLDLDLTNPRLRLLPEQNRLNVSLLLQAAGPALRRSHQGTFELDFALRYAPEDRSIRAYRLRLQRFAFPTMQPGVVALLNTYAPVVAEQAMLEVVVHQLQAKDLALAEVMGLQPGSITVTDAGLVIGFVAKPL